LLIPCFSFWAKCVKNVSSRPPEFMNYSPFQSLPLLHYPST